LRDRNKVLFALRDWSIKEYGLALGLERAKSLKAEFEAQIIRATEVLVKAGVEVVPFCMHKYAVGGDDRNFYRKLFKDFPAILKNLDSRHRKPSEDLRVFQECGAALTMRFHSCVFALATNTPMQAIDYTLGGKVESLLAEHGELENLNSFRGFNGEDVANKMIKQLGREEQLRSLDRQVVEGAFSSLVDKLESFSA
jgi:polysaccharide pyruvyl transferase WcaK-like protein